MNFLNSTLEALALNSNWIIVFVHMNAFWCTVEQATIRYHLLVV